ncbi:nitroreductase family protein [Paraburkholderia sacchari]|uniref:nitroreductase family protein n=1 Tax=Paraburkholderia sacchari TaxID=159450 RepID=UPI000542B76F|nr:nitroreductase family protein [Paraburkholderia sacchari]NLP64592.1 SagB/ThcOx family dehydrogenase [Paraburkholderia sacchari]
MTEFQRIDYQPVPLLPPAPASGEALAFIDLPRPRHDAGAPLMKALVQRKSTRMYADTPMTLDTLGELLWAANGVNRPETGGHTAPSAHGFNEIDVYVALPHGVYRYEPDLNRLALKHAVDARNMTGYQDFVGKAPLDLVYVLRGSQVLAAPRQQRELFAAIATGAICQNVSLYCASEGLATVVRGWINHRLLADALRLNEDETPILAQTVGRPAAA